MAYREDARTVISWVAFPTLTGMPKLVAGTGFGAGFGTGRGVGCGIGRGVGLGFGAVFEVETAAGREVVVRAGAVVVGGLARRVADVDVVVVVVGGGGGGGEEADRGLLLEVLAAGSLLSAEVVGVLVGSAIVDGVPEEDVAATASVLGVDDWVVAGRSRELGLVLVVEETAAGVDAAAGAGAINPGTVTASIDGPALVLLAGGRAVVGPRSARPSGAVPRWMAVGSR